MTPRTTEADAVWTLAGQLLECAAGALDDNTDAGAPDRRCVVYGADLTWDECQCGQLAVHVPRHYLSEQFPEPLVTPSNCNAAFLVAEYVITILRCVPQPDSNGRPPSCDEVSAAARVDFLDRAAVMRGVVCCLGERMHVIGDQNAVGEAGTCAGSELHVFVPSANCVPC